MYPCWDGRQSLSALDVERRSEALVMDDEPNYAALYRRRLAREAKGNGARRDAATAALPVHETPCASLAEARK